MGWSFFSDTSWTKARLVAYLMSERRLGTGQRVLRHALVGNHLWTVVEQDVQDAEPRRYIGLDLLAGGGRRGEGWGYKDLCESMGPCAVDCPLSFFDMVPAPKSEYAPAWREAVRAYHATKRRVEAAKATLVPGETVTYGGQLFTLLRPHTSRRGRAAGWIVTAVDGTRYRLTPQMVNEALANKVAAIEDPVGAGAAEESQTSAASADLFDQAA